MTVPNKCILYESCYVDAYCFVINVPKVRLEIEISSKLLECALALVSHMVFIHPIVSSDASQQNLLFSR